jgi:hypothetical protein
VFVTSVKDRPAKTNKDDEEIGDLGYWRRNLEKSNENALEVLKTHKPVVSNMISSSARSWRNS